MKNLAIMFSFISCYLMSCISFAQDATGHTKKITWQTTVEDEILKAFLEKASQRAMDEINNKGTLSEENAIPLLLKYQFNHITHLDIEQSEIRKDMVTELSEIRKDMVTKDEFYDFKSEVRWLFAISLAYITLVLGIVTYLLKRS